jgi:hypothetical protein
MVGRNLPEKISEKYLLSYTLGRGGFGQVSLVFEKVKYMSVMYTLTQFSL